MKRLFDGLLRAGAWFLVFTLPVLTIMFFVDAFLYGRYRGLLIAPLLLWVDLKLAKWLDLV